MGRKRTSRDRIASWLWFGSEGSDKILYLFRGIADMSVILLVLFL
jgi:hypothetical protein